jgi:antitoxin component HigA of HigAB toxin-antitoxin module
MNDWFKERGIGQEQVAATLNVSVSRIVNYKRDLSMRRAMILHTEYGIPFDVMYPSQLSEGEGVFVR